MHQNTGPSKTNVDQALPQRQAVGIGTNSMHVNTENQETKLSSSVHMDKTDKVVSYGLVCLHIKYFIIRGVQACAAQVYDMRTCTDMGAIVFQAIVRHTFCGA